VEWGGVLGVAVTIVLRDSTLLGVITNFARQHHGGGQNSAFKCSQHRKNGGS
jgi:hypothetical protein